MGMRSRLSPRLLRTTMLSSSMPQVAGCLSRGPYNEPADRRQENKDRHHCEYPLLSPDFSPEMAYRADMRVQCQSPVIEDVVKGLRREDVEMTARISFLETPGPSPERRRAVRRGRRMSRSMNGRPRPSWPEGQHHPPGVRSPQHRCLPSWQRRVERDRPLARSRRSVK